MGGSGVGFDYTRRDENQGQFLLHPHAPNHKSMVVHPQIGFSRTNLYGLRQKREKIRSSTEDTSFAYAIQEQSKSTAHTSHIYELKTAED